MRSLTAAQRRVEPFTYGESRPTAVDAEMPDAAPGSPVIAEYPALARLFQARAAADC